MFLPIMFFQVPGIKSEFLECIQSAEEEKKGIEEWKEADKQDHFIKYK